MAQAPLTKVWDKSYGGNSNDILITSISTSDNGFLLGGFSYSDKSGDKTENAKGGTDYWIVKLKSDGSKAWDKTYGGTSDDYLSSIIETADGYLLGGYTSSDAGGDKTDVSRGNSDYWIVKIDTNGNIIWDKTFGGDDSEQLKSMIITSDGGLLLGGSSDSGSGYDKTEESRGGADYWIVKLNVDGDKVWDKTYGGNNYDELASMVLVPDGNVLLGGTSGSNGGAEKSEDGRGHTDYWIIKIDTSGNRIWDRTLGGSGIDELTTLSITNYGNYLVGGISESITGYDKTGGVKGNPLIALQFDYWLINVSSEGDKVWDKTFGGEGVEVLKSVLPTLDGGFLLGGYSNSNSRYDKTENSRGGNDYWIVRISLNGNKLWDKTYGGSSDDKLYSLGNTIDGGFLLSGNSYSKADYDKLSYSGFDGFWIVNVNTNDIKITIQPIDKIITGGQNSSFSVEASGDNLTYQWQVSSDGGKSFTNISNGLIYSDVTAPNLAIKKVPISMNGYQYRVQVSNGAISTSIAAKLTVNVPAFDNSRVWQTVGKAGFTSGRADFISLAVGPNSTPYVALRDAANESRVSVMKFTKDDWETVGKLGFSNINAHHISLKFDSNSTPYVAYNASGASVKKFTGLDWDDVGIINPEISAKGITFTGVPSLAFGSNQSPFVAYMEGENYRASVLKLASTEWLSVGREGFTVGYAGNITLDVDDNNTPFVAFRDGENDTKLSVMKFTSNSWKPVGTLGFSSGPAAQPSITVDTNGTPYVAFVDLDMDKRLTVMKFNGSIWETVGDKWITKGKATLPSLQLDSSGTPYVAFLDSLDGYKVSLVRFNGSVWEAVGSSVISLGRANFPSLAIDADDIPFVAFSDITYGNKATVMKLVPILGSSDMFSGIISTPTGTPLNDVTVKLSGTTDKQAFTTSSTGSFSFTTTETDAYSLAPISRVEEDAMNGITTLDIVQIQRHILGRQLLSSPYKIIASDVNNSGSVTTLDIALIRSLILQNTTSFPGGKMWSFVKSDFSFTDPTNPFPYDSTRTYVKASSLNNQDFIGIKLGDVNDSWDASTARVASAGNLYFNLQGQQVSPAAEVVVPVTVRSFKNVSGYQFTLNWDPNVLEYAGVTHSEVQADFGTHSVSQGRLTSMWTEPSGSSLSLEDGSKLFYVRFKVTGESGAESKVEINSSVTRGVAYTGDLKQLNVQAQQATVKVKAAEYSLQQNSPNPFSESGTSIRFSIPQQEQVSISIYNSLGQLVRNYRATYAAGEHELIWDGRNIKGQKLSQGTYIYRMEAGSFSEAKRAIIL